MLKRKCSLLLAGSIISKSQPDERYWSMNLCLFQDDVRTGWRERSKWKIQYISLCMKHSQNVAATPQSTDTAPRQARRGWQPYGFTVKRHSLSPQVRGSADGSECCTSLNLKQTHIKGSALIWRKADDKNKQLSVPRAGNMFLTTYCSILTGPA